MTGVVCVGLTVLDVVARIDAPPVPGHKQIARSTELTVGGPAANAAICAARLIGGATLVTGLGGSPAGLMAAAELAAHGVEVVDLAPPDWALPVASCLVEPAGERTVISPGALDSPFTLSPAARETMTGASAVLLDGHHPRAASQVVALRASIAGPVVLDAGSAKAHAEAWLPLLDVVAGSADYAAALGLDLAGALDHVLAAGAGAAVMTDGPAPVLLRGANESAVSTVLPPLTDAVDTLGAGDAFHGALVAGLVKGLGLLPAVEWACRVAATRVAHVGARAWLDRLPPVHAT